MALHLPLGVSQIAHTLSLDSTKADGCNPATKMGFATDSRTYIFGAKNRRWQLNKFRTYFISSLVQTTKYKISMIWLIVINLSIVWWRFRELAGKVKGWFASLPRPHICLDSRHIRGPLQMKSLSVDIWPLGSCLWFCHWYYITYHYLAFPGDGHWLIDLRILPQPAETAGALLWLVLLEP